MATSGIRDYDVFCRCDGEQFAAIFPGCGIEGALHAVNRVRLVVESTPLVTGSHQVEIRFSAGIAELSGHEDANALVARARDALNAAKHAGRNCVLAARMVV